MQIPNALVVAFFVVFFGTIEISSCKHDCEDEYAVRCFTEEFGCIRRDQICDHRINCEDGSDEELCLYEGCAGDWIQRCRDNHRCIWVGFHCSGYDRCQDGTLDVNCTSCRMNGYLCPNSSRCARPEKKCTGYDVCYDGSTDENCTSCSESGYHCLNNRCIRPEKLCNGRDECGDGGSSNRNCTACFGGATKCQGNPTRCVLPQDYCTGLDACEDGSTDRDCEGCRQGAILFGKTKRCVRPEFLCSGRNESGDGTSDFNCRVCHDDAFHCMNNRCVRPDFRCNGQDVCGDGSTNLNCTVCQGKGVLCPEDSKCILAEKVCNGHWDCTKGTDEMHCAQTHSSSHAMHIVYGLLLIVLAGIIIGLVWYYKFRPGALIFRWSPKQHINLLNN